MHTAKVALNCINESDWCGRHGQHCKASLTLARILFPQCHPAPNMACQVMSFWWHKVCRDQDSKVTHSLRHVVPSVTHKLQTVHERRECSATPNVHFTTWKFFWTFQNFRHDIAHATLPDPHRHASPRTHCHEFFPYWHAELRAVA